MRYFLQNFVFKRGRYLSLFCLILFSLSAYSNSEYYYFFTEFHTYPSGKGKIYVSDDKSIDPSTITDWKDEMEIEECSWSIGGKDYYVYGKSDDYFITGVAEGTRPDETSDWTPKTDENGNIVIKNQDTPPRYSPSSNIHDKDSLTCVSKAPMFPTHCAYLLFTRVAAKVATGYKNFGSVTCSKVINDTGDNITLEAVPADERCHFTHWVRKSDGGKVETNPLPVTVSGKEEYTAYFSCDSATVINEPNGGFMIWYSENSNTITGPGVAISYSFAQDSLKQADNNAWYVGKRTNTGSSLYTATPQILYVEGEVFVCNTPQYNEAYNLSKPLAQWSGESGVPASEISEGLVYYAVDIENNCFVKLSDVSSGIAPKTMYLALSESMFEGNVPEKIYWSAEDASTATGISTVDVKAAARLGRIYNINGIKVKSLGRDGIYIIDGKKVIHKNK